MRSESSDHGAGEEQDAPEHQTVLGRARDLFELFLDELANRSEERDLTVEQVLWRLEDAEMFEPVVDAFHDAILERETTWVTRASEEHQRFTERLRVPYGAGLDGLLGFVDLCIESAVDSYQRASGEIDATGEVLLDLHARACLAAKEIHTLLSNGYPSGALGTWRTLHELSVIATILDEHGRDAQFNLTERWLAQDAVIHFRDAEVFQARAARLGYEPLSATELDELRQRSDDARRAYGRAIVMKSEYGWASEFCKPAHPSFRRLEELAGRGHLRGHYRWASHRVHGDSRGNRHNVFTRLGQSYRLVGPTNIGLIDAADLTLGSLWVATNCVLTGLRPERHAEPEEVVMMLTLGKLYERVSASFLKGEDEVEQAELLIEGSLRETSPAPDD